MTLRPVVAIAGTHAEGAEWWKPGSAWAQHIAAYGWRFCGHEPFEWSCDLDGTFWEGGRRHRDWQAGGTALRYYLGGAFHPFRPGVIVAHSHALQVVLYAAASGLKVPALVSVMSPVRKDMADVAARARPNIGYWCHVSTGHRDKWQWLGELFDGRAGVVREHPLADVNERVEGADHSQVLVDPQWFGVWHRIAKGVEVNDVEEAAGVGTQDVRADRG
jgi:hypothetical protein